MSHFRALLLVVAAICAYAEVLDGGSDGPSTAAISSKDVLVWPREGGPSAMHELQHWFKSNGGVMNDKLHLTPGGRLFFKDEVFQNEEMFAVPRWLMLSGMKSREHILGQSLQPKPRHSRLTLPNHRVCARARGRLFR